MSTPLLVNCRGFLKAATLAGATVALGRLPWPALRAGGSRVADASVPGWVDKPMRWAQLTLAENDPVKFDLQFWLDYFKRTRSDAVCLSGGVASPIIRRRFPSITAARG